MYKLQAFLQNCTKYSLIWSSIAVLVIILLVMILLIYFGLDSKKVACVDMRQVVSHISRTLHTKYPDLNDNDLRGKIEYSKYQAQQAILDYREHHNIIVITVSTDLLDKRARYIDITKNIIEFLDRSGL